jgi:VCBS repeat protein
MVGGRTAVAALVLCAVLGGAGNAHGSLTFEPAQPFGEVPKGSADFDGDGLDDIVTTSDSNVVIHYSDGVGGFLGSESFPTEGDAPFGLAVEDFDGDGFPDVATANWGSDDVSVLRHDGADGLSAPVTFDAVDMPADLVAADFDGDGHTDLVVSTIQNGDVAFLAGDGQGGFDSAVPHPAGGNPTELVWGDFDGDGRNDVALAPGGVGAPEAQILLGKPEGSDGTVFEAPVPAGGGTGGKRLATGDLNGDALTDLGILNLVSGTVVTVLGDDGRTFTPVTAVAAPIPGGEREDVAFADFDGDGLDDLVYGEYNPFLAFRDIVLSVGNGQGGFDFHGRFEALGAGARNLLALHLSEDEEVDVATDGGLFLGTALTLEPAVIQFPSRRVGTTGSPVTVVVENLGTAPYHVSDSRLVVDDGAFAVGADSCTGGDLAVGESCTIALTFAAPAVGLHEDELLVDTTAGPYGVAISGRALAVPSVDAMPASLSFADVRMGDSSTGLSVQIANRGDSPVAIGGVSLAGADVSAFQVLTSSCSPGPLAALASCSVSVRFRPTRTGSHGATLRVEHDGHGGAASVPLAGNGTPPFSVDVGAIDFGEVQVGQRAERTVTVTRHRTPPRGFVSIAVGGPDVATLRSSRTCARGATTCALRVTFAPDSARRHSAQVTVTADGFEVVVPLTGLGTAAPKPAPSMGSLLRARLTSAVRAWRRGGRRAALRRSLPVTGFRAPVNGSLRLVVRKAKGPILARGSVRARTGIPARIRPRLTRAGRRSLRSGRPVRVVATLEFVAAEGGRRSRVRATALLR